MPRPEVCKEGTGLLELAIVKQDENENTSTRRHVHLPLPGFSFKVSNDKMTYFHNLV